jgi:UDP-galactopyranose mutase
MYPVNTGINNDMFDIYLTAMCREKNICPIGRLGLFKYLDMDKAVEVAFDMVPMLENYLSFSPLERVNEIKKIISNR